MKIETSKLAARRWQWIVAGTLAAPFMSAATAHADVEPLLQTQWGQDGDWQASTPLKDGERTFPGCTTIASAQILYYYQYQAQATSDVCYGLDHDPLSGPDVVDGDLLCIDFGSSPVSYDFGAMAQDDAESRARTDAAAEFIYHVAVTLNAQFGGGQGSSATGRQVENAFRYQWGFNNKSRRSMSIIAKDAFGYSDAEWAALIRSELDAGRPVLYMAQQADADAGHAFVIDGYRESDGKVHVNFGWGGYADGYKDPNVLEDASGRQWNRDAMIFRGLEPEDGMAAQMLASTQPNVSSGYSWNGNMSMISKTSGSQTGYGLTVDESAIHPGSVSDPVVFLQWEVDTADASRLQISADGMDTATIRYGTWNDRSQDRVYTDVSLPFVLDPTRDGMTVADGEWFVVSVAFDDKPATSVPVVATGTTAAASSATSAPASALTVDGGTWNGNGSLISLSSGTATGYGLTRDETMIHPTSDKDPIVFFQWELDQRDGMTVVLDAEGMGQATLTYGAWGSRDEDVTRTVALPYTLDPAADGKSTADGEYYVIKVAFDEAPSQATAVTAVIE
ncbi:MAG: C10 family peptidase [Myxococcota bacterium]